MAMPYFWVSSRIARSCWQTAGGACGGPPKPGTPPGIVPGMPGMPPNCAPAADGAARVATSTRARPTVMAFPLRPGRLLESPDPRGHPTNRICRGHDIRMVLFLALLLAAGMAHWLYGRMVVAAAGCRRLRSRHPD